MKDYKELMHKITSVKDHSIYSENKDVVNKFKEIHNDDNKMGKSFNNNIVNNVE